MRLSFCVLVILLLLTSRASAATVSGSEYIDGRRIKALKGTAQLSADGWAYWAVPVEASGAYTATVYAKGKYRADTLSGGQWQPAGNFTGTASFPAESGCVAVQAQGEVTVYAVEVD